MDNEIETKETETETVEKQDQEGQEKLYTKEEVLRLIQSEADRRTNQALETQKKKFEKQLSLSRLDGDERAKAEKDNRIAELEEQLAQFRIEKNKSELKSVLSARGLSAEFADIISIGDDIELAQANIDKLDKLFKAAVRAEVERRLAGKDLKGHGGAASTPELTKEAALKMSMAELAKFEREHPEQFAKFFG